METIYYTHDYKNDTTYTFKQGTERSEITMTFTSEDPDYGTETLVYGGDGTEKELREDLLDEISETLDMQEHGLCGCMEQPWKDWDENYVRTSLIAFNNMLLSMQKGA